VIAALESFRFLIRPTFVARRQITVFWGDTVLEVRSVEGPIPTFDPPLVIRVDSLDDVDPLPRPPKRAWIRSATLFSAIAHALVLVIIATLPAMNPKDEERERISKMQGYLGRIAEQDREVAGVVGKGDDQGAEAVGLALDDHTTSLAPLVFQPNEALVPTVRASAPSTLAPKLGRPRTGARRREGGGGGLGGASSCVAFANSPEHDSKNNTWIEFVLEDDAGHPVPNERYRVTLPDGSVHEGLTDKRGLVCFTGIKGGDAKVEFPNVDARYAGSSPKPI
jgi:hypothetical protein